MKKFLYYFLQWTWQLPLNIVSGTIYLICKAMGKKQERFYNAFITYLDWNQGGISLGQFIFMKNNHPNKNWTYNTRIHEYGHTFQAILLGPLYLIVIGIPSAAWCHFFNAGAKSTINPITICSAKNGRTSSGRSTRGLR